MQFTDDGELTVIQGEERIMASGIVGVIACILSTITSMISGIIWAVLTLNILAIFEALFNGVAGLLSCIFQILV